jgi:hypothetical protein
MSSKINKVQVLDRIKGYYRLKSNAKLASFLGVAPTTVSSWYSRETFDIDVLYSKCVDLSFDWLLTGEGPMLRFDQSAIISYEPTIGVPYYDVDFIAGFDQIFNDQTLLPSHNIVFKPFDRATLWCNVTGHSMEQKINHGDILALKECTVDDVQYGEIYAVVLDTIRTVKILRKSEDPNKFRYVPVNKAEYDDQDFDKSRIIKIYEVLGNISKFF